ncbi:Asparagine synthase [compost metagenome]
MRRKAARASPPNVDRPHRLQSRGAKMDAETKGVPPASNHDGALLSAAIRAVRRLRGMSSRDTAEAMHMPLRTYQRFESGETRPNLDHIHRFARATRSDPHALVMAVAIGAPELAVRTVENHLATIITVGLQTFNRTQGDRIWTPAGHIHRPDLLALQPPEAAAQLRDALKEAVDGLASATDAVAAEVSGGLDSSLVAAALHPSHQVRLWLNAFGPGPGADERRFVQALAAHLDIEVTTYSRRPSVLTRKELEAAPQRLRPSLAALDGAFDQEWAVRCAKAGVDALFTGKGGDGLLIQPATSKVFTDLWRLKGWRSLASPDLAHLARLNERSVWTLVAEARRWRGQMDRPRPGQDLFTPLATSPARHPWLKEASAWGPAKTVQVLSLLQGHGLHGPSRLTAAVDVFHPLLSQPVIEACLGLSTPQLTLGRRDRALARLAFQDQLPPEIIQRRSKGELTAFFGRMIADGLEDLRPWLLDGRLAALGIIDRRSAEAILTRDALIRGGDYPDILVAALFEGWVRAWDSRLRT